MIRSIVQPYLEEAWVWGFQVESLDEHDMHIDKIESLDGFCEGVSQQKIPSAQPEHSSPEDVHTTEETKVFRLTEDQLNLLFKVQGEFVDLCFKIEQMDNKISLLLALCSRLVSLKSNEDMPIHNVASSNISILLQSYQNGCNNFQK
jgi:hypothetical protein